VTLAVGAKLGPYEIVAPLGKGGMGEVYRARDAKLGREVALKVLPETVAKDADRMARFQREAQVLASLNHPNIAAIYGLEDSGSVHALVMELVEGETLAERLVAPASGRQAAGTAALPLGEALPIAKQIAEGIEYAHERGIVHRDLKPANIKVTPEGAVKVLDFGLAKALEGNAAATDISNSPTLSGLATQQGVVLGTAAYMSPEQARGKLVDRRTDIWAFGCVLYEMLTGKRAFGGETISDVLAAIIRAEPDWTAVPAGTPAAMGRMLRRCLQKDPKQRLQAIGDARITIEETLSGAEVAPVSDRQVPGAGETPAIQTRWVRALPWALLGAAVIVLGVVSAGYLSRAPKAAPAVVSQILPPPGENFALGGQAAGPPVFSPDGQKLAFAALGSDGRQRLWIRPVDSATAQALAGSGGATYPFWSPDSHYLGFFANGKLDRIDASGGPPLAVCDAPNGRGGTWGIDGTILFTPDITSGIYRVPSTGGTPKEVPGLEASGERIGRWPQFLPDGKHFLFFRHGSDVAMSGGTFVASIDGGEPKLIVQGTSNALYAPPGYLLFLIRGALMAQRFDLSRLTLTGDAARIAESVAEDFIVFRSVFTASGNGLLAYEAGPTAGGSFKLLWFDRSGKQLAETGTPGEYYSPRISPDGTRLAVSLGGATGNNLWVFDLARDIRTRLTFSANDLSPAWSPDGKFIAFMSGRGSLIHLYERAADGSGKTTPLLVDRANEYNPVWSSDGRYLIFERSEEAKASATEIWALPMFGDRKPFPVVRGRFGMTQPALSPDGKWLAYASQESGRPEVYVTPFGRSGGRLQVSANGGNWPDWRHDGKELFYVSTDDKIMAAGIAEQGSSLSIGKAQALFQTNYSGGPGWDYDVSPDGEKFLVVSQVAQQASAPLMLVVNWPALLKKR
jgi:Tol biopolymer transport system component